MQMLSADDLSLRSMTDEELQAAWDLWFDLAQETNPSDPPYTHGVLAAGGVRAGVPEVESGEAAPPTAAISCGGRDAAQRSDEERLLAGIRGSQASLEALLTRADDHWGLEDAVYRYYHQSFKVYSIQSLTLEIVTALRQVMPDRPFCPLFQDVLDAGTGKRFSPDANRHWAETTRPMLEAFLHARYFLEMMVKYGRVLETPPQVLPSGWAAVLTLYGLR